MPKLAWIVVSLAVLATLPGPAWAQGADEEPEAAEAPEPPGAPGPRGAARERSPAAESAQRRAAACRGEASSRNLRGPDLADAVSICLAEARLACLKRAVEAKTRGAARRDYLVKCLGET